MQYTEFLLEKNLSLNTIEVYSKFVKIWIAFLNGQVPSKYLVSCFIKQFSSNHSPNSTRLSYNVIRSYLRFQGEFKLLNDIIDIKLPTMTNIKRDVISINEFNRVKQTIKYKTFYQERDWIIFTLLFTTGIRAHEINQINIADIIDKRIRIIGKGNRSRTIYLCHYLIELLKNWKYDQLNISSSGKILSYKQINYLINKFIKKYFGMDLHPHDLRRSFATNLIRQDINIKIISELLGHMNINTTSKYIHLTDNEISKVIESVF